MHHVKAGPHPSSSCLTHTHVHLSPWLVDLDEHWSDAIGGGRREGEEGGGGRRRREEEEKGGGGGGRGRREEER